jgi:hypothetical protein
MTSRERRRPQSGGVFERRGNELQLKSKYENLNVRIKNTLRSNMLIVDSDAILKSNIECIDPTSIQNLDKLAPKQYNFKQNPEALHYGFLAQDMENLFPNLVINGGSTKAVNYLEIIPILVSKIHDLQNQIDQLKK